MTTLNLSGIKAGGSSLVPQAKPQVTPASNPIMSTLNTTSTIINKAFSPQPKVTPQAVVQPYNPPAVVTPPATITVPKKTSSDVLSYTSPLNQGINEPQKTAQNALSSAVDTYASQPTATPAPINERDQLVKDRQSAFDLYNNKDTGYSATSLKLRNDAGIDTKQKQIDELDLQDLSLQRQDAKIKEDILKKNPQGLFGGGGQQLIDQNSRDLTSQRSDLAFQKAVLNGDITRAGNIIKLKLDAQFEPVKERMDFLEKSLTINGNDMSESQKSQATKELYQLKEQDTEKKAFDKIITEAQQAGASPEEVNNARLLYSNGDKTGAVGGIAKYTKESTLSQYQKFNATESIAKDTEMRTSKAQEMVRQAGVMNAALANLQAGGDKSIATQAIISTFNKILDPTSTVREGEYDRTAQGQSLISRIQGKVGNIVQGGGGVTDATLADAVSLSNEYLKGARESIAQQNARAVAMAQQFGLNGDFVTSTKYEKPAGGDSIIQTKSGPVNNSWF